MISFSKKSGPIYLLAQNDEMKKNLRTYCLIGFWLSLSGLLLSMPDLYAQEYRQKIDSLIIGKPPEDQLKLLNNENLQWRFSDLSYAYEICDTAIVIAKQTKNKKFIAKATHNLGTIYHLAEELEIADSLYLKSIEIYKNINDSVGWSAVYHSQADLYRRISHNKKAYDVIQKAISVYLSVGDSMMLTKCYTNLANIYYSLGEYDKAYETYSEILTINKTVGDKQTELRVLINMGALFETQDQYQEALNRYSLAIQLADSLGDMYQKAIVLNNMGLVYMQTGESMKAIDVLFEAIAIKDSLGLTWAKANSILFLGKAYELESNLQRANELYIQSLKIFHEYEDMKSVATALTFIGANLHEQGEYYKAIDYYKTSLQVAQESGLTLEISENYKFLLFNYAALGLEDSISKYLDLYAGEKHKLIIDIEDENTIANKNESPVLTSYSSIESLNGRGSGIHEVFTLNWCLAVVFIMGLVVFILTLFALFICRRRIKK